MNLRIFSVVFWLASVVALSMGFYKMFVYKNPSSVFLSSVNAYVGGDAWNFVINGSYAIGYFVLFGALLIAGLMCEILLALRKNSDKEVGSDENDGADTNAI